MVRLALFILGSLAATKILRARFMLDLKRLYTTSIDAKTGFG